MRSLAQRFGANFTAGTDFVIGGSSAGGLAVYLHLAWWRSQLPPSATVVGLADSGFFVGYHHCSTKTLWTEAPKLGPKKLTQATAVTRWFYSIKRKQWHGQMAPVGILWQTGALPCHACGCPNATLCPDYPNCTTKLTAP